MQQRILSCRLWITSDDGDESRETKIME